MGWFRDNLLAASLVALLISGSLLAAVIGYAGLVLYSALVTGTPLVGVLLDLALPYLPVVAVLLVVAVVSAAGLAWALLRRLSVPRSERLAATAERLEREHSAVAALGLSDALAPPEPSAEERTEAALADLKSRYVAGELDEREFERKLDRLVRNESLDRARAAREREVALEERPDDSS